MGVRPYSRLFYERGLSSVLMSNIGLITIRVHRWVQQNTLRCTLESAPRLEAYGVVKLVHHSLQRLGGYLKDVKAAFKPLQRRGVFAQHWIRNLVLGSLALYVA